MIKYFLYIRKKF